MSGEKETLACKAHDSEKLCSPKNAASDWCVDKRAIFQYINQTRYVLFTCIADKKMLWTDDFFGLCLYEGLKKAYEGCKEGLTSIVIAPL